MGIPKGVAPGGKLWADRSLGGECGHHTQSLIKLNFERSFDIWPQNGRLVVPRVDRCECLDVLLRRTKPMSFV